MGDPEIRLSFNFQSLYHNLRVTLGSSRIFASSFRRIFGRHRRASGLGRVEFVTRGDRRRRERVQASVLTIYS
jgi:hypothetical protein